MTDSTPSGPEPDHTSTVRISVGDVQRPTVEGRPVASPGTAKPEKVRSTPLPPRSAAGQRLEKLFPRFLSGGLAAPALVWPLVGFLFVLVTASALAAAKSENTASGRGPADLVMLPVRLAQWLIQFAKPGRLAGLIVRLLAIATVSAAVPAAVAATHWAATNDGPGAIVAGRLSIYENGPRVFTFLLGYRLILSIIAGRGPVAQALMVFLRKRTEALLTGLSLAVLAILLISAFWLDVGRWRPWSTGEDAIAVLPGRVADPLLDLRNSLTEAQVMNVGRCLNETSTFRWGRFETGSIENGALSVTVTSESAGAAPDQIESRTESMALALLNQLGPWVHTITVRSPPNGSDLSIQRSSYPTDRPVLALDPSHDLGSTGIDPKDLQAAINCAVSNI